MTEEQKELLKNAGISESDIEFCFISEDGIIYTPIKDGDKIFKTGEEFYKEIYLNPPAQQLSETELLKAQLLETQALVANLQEQILLNK